MLNGAVYIELPPPYNNETIYLGRFSEQVENYEFIGNRTRSANGTLKVYSIGNKKQWQLSGGDTLSFAEYIKISNYLKTRQGEVEKVYFDTEGGFKYCIISATFKRVLGKDGEYQATYTIKEV